MSMPHRRFGTSRRHPGLRLEQLEPRALLSLTPGDAARIATEISVDLLHHTPGARAEAVMVRRLEAGWPAVAVADTILISQEYTRAHPNAASFVTGLYRDVLGTDPDPAGVTFWTGRLAHGAGRAVVGRDFLAAPGSFLQQMLGATAGVVSNVTTNKVWTTGINGSLASTAGAFNQGDAQQPAIVTISVTAAGTYTLDQGRVGFITNNTGRVWRGFTLAILPTSTAGATFTSSSNQTAGQFPAPAVAAKTVTYANGRVPSQLFPPFAPFTMIRTTSGGTIVIQETPTY